MQRLNRQQKRELTRGLLRQSAAHAFASQGVGAASVDAISQAAGLSRGAFYANYESKEALLLEVMQGWLDQEAVQWMRLVGEARDVEAILQGLLGRFERVHREGSRGLLLTELALHAERHPGFAIHYQSFLAAHHALVAQVFATLFEKAGKKPPVDPQTLAAVAMSFGSALALQSMRTIRHGDPAFAGEMFLLYLRGMLAVADPVIQERDA